MMQVRITKSPEGGFDLRVKHARWLRLPQAVGHCGTVEDVRALVAEQAAKNESARGKTATAA